MREKLGEENGSYTSGVVINSAPSTQCTYVLKCFTLLSLNRPDH